MIRIGQEQFWVQRQFQSGPTNWHQVFFPLDGKNPRLSLCCKIFIQIGQNHSMGYELNLFSGGVKIINSPITSIIIDIPRNFNSPIGDIPWDSINILNIGPLIGRKNNTNKTPILCLRPINIRVGTHFSNHSVHRIDLGMICAR